MRQRCGAATAGVASNRLARRCLPPACLPGSARGSYKFQCALVKQSDGTLGGHCSVSGRVVSRHWARAALNFLILPACVRAAQRTRTALPFFCQRRSLRIGAAARRCLSAAFIRGWQQQQQQHIAIIRATTTWLPPNLRKSTDFVQGRERKRTFRLARHDPQRDVRSSQRANDHMNEPPRIH